MTRRTSVSVLWLALLLVRASKADEPWIAVPVTGYRDQPLNRITFVTERVGWISAGFRTLIKTEDGGQTWSVMQTDLTDTDIDLATVWFLDETHGWAAGSKAHTPALWHTVDGGKHWQRQQITAESGQAQGSLLDVRFSDKMHGWAVGFAGARSVVIATQDGGRRWSTKSPSDSVIQLRRVLPVTSRNVWALGLDAVLQSNDAGLTWERRYFGPAVLNDLDGDSSGMWIAGGWGHILVFSKAGLPTKVAMGMQYSDEFIGYVKFVDPQRGWVVGTTCNILSTRDAGKTWVAEPCPKLPEGTTITTGSFASTTSKVYMLASPSHVLIRRRN